jgi:hypothetical protein
MSIISRLRSSWNKEKHVQLRRPDYAGRHAGRTALILATGPSVKRYWREIDEFRKDCNAITLGSNNIGEVYAPNYHAFTNTKRFEQFARSVDKARSTAFVSPYLESSVIRRHKMKNVEEIMFVNDHKALFDIEDGVIQASCRTTAVLLIAIAIVMEMSRIYIAGMDGYSHLPQGGSTHFYQSGEKLVEDGDALHQNLMNTEAENQKFLDEISEYLLRRSLRPFSIITPTVHENHFRSIDVARQDFDQNLS